MPTRAGNMASNRIGVCDVEETKRPAREYLRATFLDDQEVGQGGQLCQMENTLGFNGFQEGGFR
jgi:hypothetical protein